MGMASFALRGNCSKCWTNTRITGSGSSNAASSSFTRRRSRMPSIAVRTAAVFTKLVSTAEGTMAPAGKASTAESVNKSHLVNFAERRHAKFYLGHAALAQSNHALFARHPLDFRSGPTIDNHFTNAVGKIQ